MSSGRVNQKARTRESLLAAAVALLREGKQPSVPDAANRARVSVATAYRYFPTAEDLQSEASMEAADFATLYAEVDAAIERAGSDAAARLDALVTTLGWRMLEDQAPYRTMARLGLDRWFAQAGNSGESAPVRQGRRTRWLRMVVEPLRATMSTEDCDQLEAAFTVSLGTEAMIALFDVARLDVKAAKAVMLQTNRWILAGAIDQAAKKKPRSR